MEFLARMVLFGGLSMALLGCGEDHPTASEPVLNTELRSHNMGAYLIRLWDQSRGELLYTDGRVNVWIDWQFLDSTALGERGLQIDGTYDIQFENTTDRKVGATLIRLSFKNARNGPVSEFLYAPERQIALDPMEVLNVNGEFQAVVDDLSQAEVIVNIEVGARFTFSR